MQSLDKFKCLHLVFWLGIAMCSIFKKESSQWSNKKQTIRAKIVACHDGDTCKALHNSKKITLRLLGIDAPELAQEPVALSKASRERLRALTVNKLCTLKIHGLDRYKRHLTEIHCSKNFVNKTLVEEGLAYAYPGLHQRGLDWAESAELEARKKQLGIFQGKALKQTPWEYRKNINKRTL